MGVKENLKNLKEQTGNYTVKIIAVTKYATDEQIKEAYQEGITDFGESYVQDATKKILKFKDLNAIKWHFIGRLQKNKVKYLIGDFYLIHSVDSYELAEIINNYTKRKEVNQKILLQVNVTSEATKAGFSQEGVIKIFQKIFELKNITVIGLMTIAPNTSDKNITKDCFLKLNNLRKEINNTFNVNLKELSMGMSNDYKIAIECGSTMLRLGRAIFSNYKVF